MGSLKKLNKADITRVPYAANKQWNLDYSCTPYNDSYINIYKGTKITGSFSSEKTSIDPITNGQYERLVYDSINHLFYQSYYDSVLNTGSLMFNINTYESASQQRPTSSYFNYNSNPYFIDTLPTGSGDGIRVLVINQDIYGSKVLPHSFNLKLSGYDIKDDGYGNLYDVYKAENNYADLNFVTQEYFKDRFPNADLILVGNIFYAHGIATINHPNYQNIFDLPPLAIEDNAVFQDVDTPKTINILSNDIERNGKTWSIDPTTVTLYGNNTSYYTINPNGTITLNTTTPGSYDVYYTVNSVNEATSCVLTSNKAKITADVFMLPPTPICINYNPCVDSIVPIDYLFNNWSLTLPNQPKRCYMGGSAVNIEDFIRKCKVIPSKSFQIIEFTINGVQYGTNQILTVNTPGGVTEKTYLDSSGQYYSNIEDWINSICLGTGLIFHDQMAVVDTPSANFTYTLVVRRLYGGKGDYWYTDKGFTYGPDNYIPAPSDFTPFTSCVNL